MTAIHNKGKPRNKDNNKLKSRYTNHNKEWISEKITKTRALRSLTVESLKKMVQNRLEEVQPALFCACVYV